MTLLFPNGNRAVFKNNRNGLRLQIISGCVSIVDKDGCYVVTIPNSSGAILCEDGFTFIPAKRRRAIRRELGGSR